MKKLVIFFLFLYTSFLIISSHQDGFCENTLVITPSGYQKIQELYIGDTIYDQHFQEKIITHTFQYLADQYVQISLNDEIINCAVHQPFYLPEYHQWITAFDVPEHTCDSLKIINLPTIIYCITTQDHTFQVSHHNIIVHNSIAAPVAQSILLSCIRLIQPVSTLLGATLSLYYCSSFNPSVTQNNTIIYQASPEKIYFDTRYQQLMKLKQEFLSVHTTLKTIKCQFQDQYTLLSYQQLFNHQFTNTFNITAQQEATLDFEDRLQLTDIRQKILEDFEEEICNIQIALGLFVHEMLYRRSATIEYYNNFTSNVDPIHYCLKLPNNITYQTILTYYIFTATCNMLMEEIDSRNKECLLLCQLFQKKNEIVHATTNILDVLYQTQHDITLSQPGIERTKLGNQIKIQNVIIYFKQNQKLAHPNINQQINNVKNELHQSFQNKSKNKAQSYPQINPPPKKPDQDDDDREIPRIYVDAKYHAKNASAIKSAAPKNGQAALDFSLPVTKKIRVGVSENEIVILGRTLIKPQGGSEWHGYATTWEDLNKEQKEKFKTTLIENGLVNSRGKIL